MSGGSDDCIQFTRHAGDVLFNFNQLRSRNILTDVTILVGGREFYAHKTVLMACSGFFYSIFINAQQTDLKVVSLDAKADPDGFEILLEFMYTSCLTLKECYVVGTLSTAVYLQMEHMVETCRRYMECRGLSVKPSGEQPASFPHLFHGKSNNLRTRAPPVLHYAVSTSTSNPTRIYSRLNPLPGSISNTKALHNCKVTQGPGFSLNGTSLVPGTDHCTRPSIVLQQGDRSSVKAEEGEAANFIQSHFVDPRSPLKSDCQPNSPAESSGCGREASSPKVHNWKKYKFIVLNENLSSKSTESTPLDVKRSEDKCELTTKAQTPLPTCTPSVGDQSNASTSEIKHGEKPYRCGVCGAQFNRPANLKTHLRIHSGEKPYKCETCGSAFVQVAHLRAHVLIHTGEKPYSCSVCSTRFRHLQTLKSHMRIHTGEKPYQCDSCNLRFRHKSQLRLHLRQKHGWITNSKASKS